MSDAESLTPRPIVVVICPNAKKCLLGLRPIMAGKTRKPGPLPHRRADRERPHRMFDVTARHYAGGTRTSPPKPDVTLRKALCSHWSAIPKNLGFGAAPLGGTDLVLGGDRRSRPDMGMDRAVYGHAPPHDASRGHPSRLVSSSLGLPTMREVTDMYIMYTYISIYSRRARV